MTPPSKLVLFDALHTLVAPRRPISAQYARVFRRFLGPVDEALVAQEFPIALKFLQRTRPAYSGGKDSWWSDVVRRTAIASGANAEAVERSLPQMMVTLMDIFRTREGYMLFDDVEGTLRTLHSMHIRTGVVSNTDSRMRDALFDLGIARYLDPIVLSDEEGIEKPSADIWRRACERIGVPLGPNVLHVGDELEADFHGAKAAGLQAALLRRNPLEPQYGDSERLSNVAVIENLSELLQLDFFKCH